MRRDRTSLALAVVTAAGLAYDAKVHLHLAGGYDAIGDTITQGALFRVEAVAALLAAVLVLVVDHRLAWATAAMTGLAGVAAVLLYRYVDVGAIGPIPNMYEPAWYPEKLNSLYAEAVVAVAALTGGIRYLRQQQRPAAQPGRAA